LTGPQATSLFRLAFLAAGCHDLVFGAWMVLAPGTLWGLLGLPSPGHELAVSLLGAIVAAFGLLYLRAARHLDRATPIIALGILGKVLWPIGIATLMVVAGWPARAGLLAVLNGLIWWLPFTLFLLRRSRFAAAIERAAPWLCVVVHVLALAVLVLTLRGTEIQPDVGARAAFIVEHVVSWRLGWALWMVAALSLVGFYAWWGARLAARSIAIFAVALTWVGTVCDLSGEMVWSLLAVEAARQGGDLAATQRAGTLLSAGAANGIYTVAGMFLTRATPGLPRAVQASMWATWAAGILMTIGAIAGSIAVMTVSTAVLFPLLLAWTIWMARHWARR
jgi:hypothetical protein